MQAFTANLKPFPTEGLKPFAPQAIGSGKRPLDTDQKLRRRVKRRRFVHMTRVERAAEHIGTLPTVGETIHSTQTGAFDGWAIIDAIIRLAGCPAAELFISTLGFNSANAVNLFSALDAGTVRSIPIFIVSSYFRGVDKSKDFADLDHGLRDRGYTVTVRRCHAKVQLLHMEDGRRYVVNSSGNLRSSRNLEVFDLSRDDALFDWHAGWMRELVEKGSDR